MFIENTEIPQDILLLDQLMELLPVDVASSFFSGTDNPPVMYSLVNSIQIEDPGCLDVHAVITQESNAAPLYQSKLIIPGC